MEFSKGSSRKKENDFIAVRHRDIGVMARRKKKQQPLFPEFDFHGLTGEQAAIRLQSILDQYQGKAGQQIHIIHGKGNGILEQEVERLGKSDPRVESVEKSFFNPGITILILNDKTRPPSPIRSVSEWDHVPIPPVRRRKR